MKDIGQDNRYVFISDQQKGLVAVFEEMFQRRKTSKGKAKDDATASQAPASASQGTASASQDPADSPYIQQPKSKLKSQLKIQKHCSNTKEQQHEDSQTQNLHPNEKHEQQHHKSAEPKLNQIEIELKPNEIDDKI
ncbi:hypothetical protein P8452_08562 [Trifolium repens]|nr:hypothetical protein P8452_08562 [Trifolium repens]